MTIAWVASTAEKRNGPRSSSTAELAEENGGVEHAEREAAVRFGHEKTWPSHLRHPAVEGLRRPRRGLRGLSHDAGRALAREEVASALLQQLLVGREAEVHPQLPFGMPRPRSEMMFFWI
jgi:hypothetical protein